MPPVTNTHSQSPNYYYLFNLATSV